MIAEPGDTVGDRVADILVVDHQAENRRLLVQQLRQLGEFQVHEAASGDDAVAAVRTEVPDVISTHVGVRPGLPGWAATRAIREMDGGENIYIVAWTVQAMPGDEGAALTAGYDECVTLPPPTGTLRAVLGRALAARVGTGRDA
jgi:CheY-like chemotaxis protein